MLYEDIELQNKYGYEVLCKKSRSNEYYVIDRKFERSEVQVLLSTVGAAKSLSDKKTGMLMQKLYELLGATEAEHLHVMISVANKNNERIYYTIDAITTAILEKKKLSFLYLNYGIPMIAHSYGEEQTKAATCTEDRYTYKKCSVCGHEEKLQLLLLMDIRLASGW